MRKQRFKTIKLFLKLILLFQIYSHNTFPAEATQYSILKGCHENDAGAGTDMKGEDSVLERPKKPARLLPLRMILGKEKNKPVIENASNNKRFYGPATSCEELLKIGYTRNGFYLVKGNATSNNSHVEIVDCLFKHPSGVKEVKEKRLGPIPLKIKETKLHQRRSVEAFLHSKIELDQIELERSKRPIRLLPLHILYGNEKNDTEEGNAQKPFYGPPSNCVDLSKLGYTLNGYYLVNGSKSSNNIEIVLCRFQLPPGVNETALEERLGFINMDKITTIMDQKQSFNQEFKAILGRKIRPVRLLPPRRQIEKRENKTTEQKVQRLNSNPANCNDIGMLGHTLNGYYLVNSSKSAGQFGVTHCQFKLPRDANRTTNEDKFGFVNLLEEIDETSNETKSMNSFFNSTVKNNGEINKTSFETKKQSSNCKNRAVLITDEEFVNLCMEPDLGWNIRFEKCNSSKTDQQWVILKTENDRDYVRICQRRADNRRVPYAFFIKLPGYLTTHYCLRADNLTFHPRYYQQMVQTPFDRLTIKSKPIEPNKEAREVRFLPNNEGDTSQQWIMNSTTHQFSSVKYPKVCITTRHFEDPAVGLLLQCKDSESPNPQLPKHRRFFPIPALDKNGEQLCSD